MNSQARSGGELRRANSVRPSISKKRVPTKSGFCGNKRNKNAEISKRALEKLDELDLSCCIWCADGRTVCARRVWVCFAGAAISRPRAHGMRPYTCSSARGTLCAPTYGAPQGARRAPAPFGFASQGRLSAARGRMICAPTYGAPQGARCAPAWFGLDSVGAAISRPWAHGMRPCTSCPCRGILYTH